MKPNDEFYRSAVDHMHEGVYFVDLERRIRYWNPAAERITGYRSVDVVGTCCQDDLLRHVDAQGRSLCEGLCPLAQTMADGRAREAAVFFHHKDGHQQPVSVRTAPVRDSNGEIVGGVETFTDSSEMVTARQKMDELQRQALLDTLTELGNRRYLEMTLESRLGDLRRFGWTFGMLFIDLDHFKQINDEHGHPVGDRMLQLVARTLTFSSRAGDVVGRWGGEEFVVLLSSIDAANLPGAAARFHQLLTASRLPESDREISLTVSIGGTLASPGDSVESIFKRADALMYESKKAGRNRVTLDV